MNNEGNNFNANVGAEYYNSQYYQEQQRISYYKSLADKERKEIRRLGNSIGIVIVAYFIIQIAIQYFLSFSGLDDLYDNSSIFQSSFNIIGITLLCVAVPFGIMALVNKKNYEGPIIPTKKISGSRMFFWVCFGLGCSIVANYATAVVVQIFSGLGYELKSNDSLPLNSVLSCIMAFIGTAIVPAICEEFAMRCCSLQLLKKYGKSFGVVSISIVFGLLHGNIIQFVFAFLVGLVLGFATVKTDSILPAMLIHGINNSLSVISDTVTFAAGKEASSYAVMIIYGVLGVVGIIGLIGLFVKGEFKKRKNINQFSPYALTNGQKYRAFFLVPGMIVPLILLIFLSITTIVKA